MGHVGVGPFKLSSKSNKIAYVKSIQICIYFFYIYLIARLGSCDIPIG